MSSIITEKDRFDYAWKHFALIADQRVKTFNFYIIVLLAAFGATIGSLKPTTPYHICFLVGGGHVFIVAVFLMIERRGQAILKIAKAALREIEGSEAYGEGYRPMTRDLEEARGWHGRLITYGNAFRLAFAGHALFGLGLMVYPSLFKV